MQARVCVALKKQAILFLLERKLLFSTYIVFLVNIITVDRSSFLIVLHFKKKSEIILKYLLQFSIYYVN